MMRRLSNKQQGMALFQVLLMVAIIAVFLIIMSQQTQSSVVRAQQMQDQVELQLALESSAAYFDSLLISNEWLTARKDAGNPLYDINFYGIGQRRSLPDRPAYKALNYEVTLALQNEASLIDLNFNNQKLQQLFIARGKTATEARQLADELSSWIRTGEGLTLQATSELTQLPGWTAADVELVRPWCQCARQSSIQPGCRTRFCLYCLAHGKLILSKNYEKITKFQRVYYNRFTPKPILSIAAFSPVRRSACG